MSVIKDQDHHSKGEQGFAPTFKEKDKETPYKNDQSYDHKNDKHETSHSSENTKKDSSHEHGKQGFASMPHEKVQEIARKGGQSSHDHKTDKTEK